MPAIDRYARVQPMPAEKPSNILSVDIGGTLIKAAVVDHEGSLVSEFVTTPTPKPATPAAVIELIARVAGPMPTFSRLSVGFPGVVHATRIGTAPNLGTEFWKDFELARVLATTFGKPTRVLNDAIVYGLGIARGPGSECVLTFGTGMGCSLFRDGTMFHGLELGQHNAFDDCNYDQYIGHAAFLAIGVEAWNERAARVLAAVQALMNSDRIYIGGGNSRRIAFALPEWATIVPPSGGVAGGARLWHADMDGWFAAGEQARSSRVLSR